MKRLKLLTREAFRTQVFQRDKNTCVVLGCREAAQDAHHILERKLWPDGGYYLDNGASLCGPHHLEAEQCRISCEDIRRWAGIKNVVVPPHLDAKKRYDKWGNPL